MSPSTEPRTIEDAEIYVADLDVPVIVGVTITVRATQPDGGWIGVVDADLSAYADVMLEVRRGEAEPKGCAVLFVIGPDIVGTTVVRGRDLSPV